ncbi:unnamed protein product [Phaeothamnion confervicola]
MTEAGAGSETGLVVLPLPGAFMAASTAAVEAEKAEEGRREMVLMDAEGIGSGGVGWSDDDEAGDNFNFFHGASALSSGDDLTSGGGGGTAAAADPWAISGTGTGYYAEDDGILVPTGDRGGDGSVGGGDDNGGGAELGGSAADSSFSYTHHATGGSHGYAPRAYVDDAHGAYADNVYGAGSFAEEEQGDAIAAPPL